MNQSAKDIAISVLGDLAIYSPYINGFKSKKRRITFFENYAGFWIDQEDEAYQKMKEIEEKYNIMVYAVTHEYLEFGECWDFLFVPSDCKGKEELIKHYKNKSAVCQSFNGGYRVFTSKFVPFLTLKTKIKLKFPAF